MVSRSSSGSVSKCSSYAANGSFSSLAAMTSSVSQSGSWPPAAMMACMNSSAAAVRASAAAVASEFAST